LLDVARPQEFSRVVHPMILTPGFQAFPSGHATEAYFAAEVLSQLQQESVATLPADLSQDAGTKLRAQLHRMAYRIAENRVVAGVHFPWDSVAGQFLGVVLARAFLLRCGVLSACLPTQAVLQLTAPAPNEARTAEPTLDRTWNAEWVSKEESTAPNPPGPSPVLTWLWDRASEEARD
jgi:membrane-associated phospholipid phosphatase